MNKKDILQKAIERAEDNGYFHAYYSQMNDFENRDHGWYNPSFLEDSEYYRIIFSHDFAKAFWGEELVCPRCGEGSILEPNEIVDGEYDCYSCEENNIPHLTAWQWHLQQMVISEDPIQYLSQFLEPTGDLNRLNRRRTEK